ncbi:MAG: twin-arginine translocation signal domain-containing protein [Candidatus Diapherotrites archaeon]
MKVARISRRTFLRASAIGAGAASMGSVPRRKRTLADRVLEREKELRRKKMEPELVENIKTRMILILIDSKVSEQLQKELRVLVDAKNFDKAKTKHKKDLFAAIRKGLLENSLQEVSKLECGVILMEYMAEGEKAIESRGEVVSERLKNISQFLESLRNPAYDLLYTKIDRTQSN